MPFGYSPYYDCVHADRLRVCPAFPQANRKSDFLFSHLANRHVFDMNLRDGVDVEQDFLVLRLVEDTDVPRLALLRIDGITRIADESHE
jgi:hypothetical protein